MFEKEAEEYNQKVPFNPLNVEKEIRRAFQKGAEIGYNKAKEEGKVVVEHFEAYGQCRDSRRIASLEAENEKLKEQNYKTKVALRNVIDYLGRFCSDYPDCVIEAEQFLKEIKENE